MRKNTVFIVALLIASVLSACMHFQIAETKNAGGEKDSMQNSTRMNEHDIYVGDSIEMIKANHENQILLEQHSCIAWMDSNGYNIACLEDGATIRAITKFSVNLEILEASGVEPIHAISREEWVGKKEADFVSKYGSCHFDYGSGAYIPSYISENGIIYFLHVFDGTIKSISFFSPNGYSQGQFEFVSG